MKKGLDPVAAYLRFRLKGMIGEEPGQILQKDAADRVELSESGLSQFLNGHIGLTPKRFPLFAKLLRIPGDPAKAAERLVHDAAEWYGSLVGGTMPLLEEPAVQQAIALVAQSSGVSPKVVESLLAAYGNSRFLGRSSAYWVRTLAEELHYDAAAARDLAANEK